MKWARVGKAYFNTNLILAFHWSSGKLYIYWLGEPEPDIFGDPDRADYLNLCYALGVRPVEEGWDGES